MTHFFQPDPSIVTLLEMPWDSWGISLQARGQRLGATQRKWVAPVVDHELWEQSVWEQSVWMFGKSLVDLFGCCLLKSLLFLFEIKVKWI